MTAAQIFISLGIGTIAGTIAALCGVGGGVIMVPCFVFMLGLDQKNAVATSLMAMVGTALVSSIQNNRHGLGDWRIAAWTTLASMTTAWLAADWLRKLSNQRLSQIFGVLIIVMGIHMLWTAGRSAPSAKDKPGTTDRQSQP